MKAGEEQDQRSEIDLALEALLVGEERVKVDPATGQIISEKSSLTDHQDPTTIA